MIHRQRLVFFFLIAFIAPAFFVGFASAEELNPRELGNAKLSVQQTWILEFGEAKTPKEAFFETYGFPQTPYQRVSFTTNPPSETASDEFGNSRARLSLKYKQQTQHAIELNAVAEIGYANAQFEPLTQGEDEKYLKPTQLTEPSNEIKALSASLGGEAADDYEAVARTTEWVHNNVEYDASYWKREIKAEQILAEKRGVCNQFATLLIALLKARGIPARFTAGLVYSGESWGPHAWIEAGILDKDGTRKWLPVDPTFGEVGVLDAGHLKFGHGFDQNDISEIATSGVNVVKGEPHVDVLEKTNFGELFEVALNAPSLVGPGSAEEVALAVKSKANGAMALPFLIMVPSQPPSLAVRVADGESRILYLQPSEERAVSWRLVFPHDLKDDFTYNFSIAVQGFGKKVSTMVQGKTGVESRKFQKLGITRFTAKDEGARESFSIVVVNEGNEAVDSVDVLGEFNGVKQRESFSLAAGEEKRVTFVFAKPESPGVYAGGFKARDSVSGASAEQPFQLEITQENEGGGAPIVVPSVSVSAGSVPQEYLVYGAAVVLAAAIVFGVVRARRARGLRGSSASKSSSSSSSSISSSSSFGSYSNSARKS